MAALNYAQEYSRALAQAYPYVLYFAKLHGGENDRRYRWVNGKTVNLPVLSTTGAVDADNDSITLAKRNFDNQWEAKTLSFHRKWSTLLAPTDIDMTNMVATIANITQVYNEFEKFPEKDKYLVSKVYADWTAQSMAADKTVLSATNILETLDGELVKFSEARVPRAGTLLYVTPAVNKLLKGAVNRYMSGTDRELNRYLAVLDELEIVEVPSDIMKTAFDFTTGAVEDEDADQINYFMVHPSAIITPEAYTFAQVDSPSALSEGKYVYYEERFEDVFILNQRKDGIAFNITESTTGGGG